MSDFLFKDRDGQTPLLPELQKGLRPKHIQIIGELDEYEEQNIAEGLVWLSKQKDKGVTYDFWLKLHKKLFADVWEWAGKIRTHELHNPDFYPPHQIWPALRQLEGDIDYWAKLRLYALNRLKEILRLDHASVLLSRKHQIHIRFEIKMSFGEVLCPESPLID